MNHKLYQSNKRCFSQSCQQALSKLAFIITKNENEGSLARVARFDNNQAHTGNISSVNTMIF
jgi:hypothetical protein